EEVGDLHAGGGERDVVGPFAERSRIGDDRHDDGHADRQQHGDREDDQVRADRSQLDPLRVDDGGHWLPPAGAGAGGGGGGGGAPGGERGGRGRVAGGVG